MPRLRRWHRLAISAIAFVVLLQFIPVRALLRAMGQVPIRTLALTLCVFLVGHVAAALKWRLLQGHDPTLPLLATLRAHFSGVIANLWLPGVVGGDLVRVGVVYRRSQRPASVALASLVDRVIDSAALLFLAFLGLMILGAPAQDARRAFVAVLITGIFGLVVLVGAYAFLKKRWTDDRFNQVGNAVALLRQRPLALLGAFAMSAGIQTAFILVNEQLGLAVGVRAPTALWFMAWPLSKLVALVPISAAGLGIREAAIVMLMRPFHTVPEAVMASSLLWQGLLFTGGFIGWGLLSLASAKAVMVSPEALPFSRE